MIYPLIKIRFWEKAFFRACKNNRVILYIFDMRFFQYKCFNVNKDFTIKEEVMFLNHSYGCIVQTEFEEQLLKENGLTTKTYNLQFLDYFSDTFCLAKRDRIVNSIAFAGYLPRATFLNKITLKDIGDISFNVFGNDKQLNIKNNLLRYHGDYNGEELIETISCYEYGLVWDGNDTDTFGNFYAGYEKYITPHKAAAYINAGLPIIVWSGSALSHFVDKYGIGIKIDKISQIHDAINQVKENEYNDFLSHIKEIQKLTSNFCFFKSVIDSIKQ
jgi:hypothetical protein